MIESYGGLAATPLTRFGEMTERLVKEIGYLEYLKKGRLVFVEGRLQTDRWEDNKGETHYRTTVVAQTMQILDRRPEEPEEAETPVEDLAE